MTITDRKQREREEMRQLILEGARDVFLEKGYEHASLRNIAERIEYSPGTLYLYFKDKDEIFHALHEEGFRRMLVQMQPLQHVSNPFERLKAMGRVYMEFARKNKDFYDLMFIVRGPVKHEIADHEKWEMGSRTLNYLKDILRECQTIGYFQGMDIEYLSFSIWSTMHGMSALYCRERCQAYPEHDPNDLMEQGFRIYVELLDKK